MTSTTTHHLRTTAAVIILLVCTSCDEDAGSGKRSTAADQPKPEPPVASLAGKPASGTQMTGGSSSVPGKARDAVMRGVDKMKERDKAIQKQIDEQYGDSNDPPPKKMPPPDKDPE
ncbi:MAG: hypothetical protein EXS00_02995 [Phycisphaerales bacterium]|nr:hypothetical protein [Phycisphaerales bacterium]